MEKSLNPQIWKPQEASISPGPSSQQKLTFIGTHIFKYFRTWIQLTKDFVKFDLCYDLNQASGNISIVHNDGRVIKTLQISPDLHVIRSADTFMYAFISRTREPKVYGFGFLRSEDLDEFFSHYNTVFWTISSKSATQIDVNQSDVSDTSVNEGDAESSTLSDSQTFPWCEQIPNLYCYNFEQQQTEGATSSFARSQLFDQPWFEHFVDSCLNVARQQMERSFLFETRHMLLDSESAKDKSVDVDKSESDKKPDQEDNSLHEDNKLDKNDLHKVSNIKDDGLDSMKESLAGSKDDKELDQEKEGLLDPGKNDDNKSEQNKDNLPGTDINNDHALDLKKDGGLTDNKKLDGDKASLIDPGTTGDSKFDQSKDSLCDLGINNDDSIDQNKNELYKSRCSSDNRLDQKKGSLPGSGGDMSPRQEKGLLNPGKVDDNKFHQNKNSLRGLGINSDSEFDQNKESLQMPGTRDDNSFDQKNGSLKDLSDNKNNEFGQKKGSLHDLGGNDDNKFDQNKDSLRDLGTSSDDKFDQIMEGVRKPGTSDDCIFDQKIVEPGSCVGDRFGKKQDSSSRDTSSYIFGEDKNAQESETEAAGRSEFPEQGVYNLWSDPPRIIPFYEVIRFPNFQWKSIFD